MVVPIRFPSKPPEAVASFNWEDIAEGTGIIVFYAFATDSDSGLEYHLTNQPTIYSSKIESATTSGNTESLDLDFDLSQFNSPRIVEGTALISFTMTGTAGVGTTCETTATVYIRKWDGTTETNLVSDTSPLLVAVNNTVKELVTMPLTVPRTQFAKGDTLRLTFVLTTVKSAGGNSIQGAFGHDPRNRDGTIIIPSTDDPDTITSLILNMPFDIGT